MNRNSTNTGAQQLESATSWELPNPQHDPFPPEENTPCDFEARRDVADTLLEEISWETEWWGNAPCPGLHLHTTEGTEQARIFVNGTATLHCLHRSCAATVDEFNWELRRQIRRVERGLPMSRVTPMAPDSLARRVKNTEMRPFRPDWRRWFLDVIAKPLHPARLSGQSPSGLPERIGDDRFAFLSLFHPDDVIWTGEVTQSSPRNFARVQTLIRERRLHGPNVSTSSFVQGATRRCREQVQHRRFLVVESDRLSIPQQAALLKALAAKWPLAAVVFTGGKSLHGWFRWMEEWNSLEGLMEAKAQIHTYECDTAASTATQPFRLPGVLRPGSDRFQSLIYLNLAHSYARR